MIRTKIRKILVALDGSKNSFRGLNEAIYLARQCNATITGLHVIPLYPQKWGDLTNPLKTRLFKDANDMMTKAKLISAQKGIVFHQKVVYGEAKSGITDFVNQHGFDLVVVGARGFGPVRGLFLGSISTAILHRSKIPVLVVK